ncbi:hypothetical protein GQ53DRAFT_861396 [Thozetella sp. PMI_491]|nr:hypothetical protein GQ53DRAFT_861396 [Thozetella sp. PMI_491]
MASGLAALSIFSSRVMMGSEVLVAGSQCGILGAKNMSSKAEAFDLYQPRKRLMEMAAEYAQRCLSRNISATADCGSFVQKRLPMIVDSSASCPFEPSLCRRPNSSLILDTGLLDSHVHLGLNAPEAERFQYRSVTQCSPLATSGFTTQYNVSDHESFAFYNYGPTRPSDCNCTWEISMDTWDRQKNGDVTDFSGHMQLTHTDAFVQNGTLISKSSSFIPLGGLLRPDADLVLLALVPAGVTSGTPTKDDWYRFTTPVETKYFDGQGHLVQIDTEYVGDEPIFPMGCIRQDQLCNPNLPEDKRCAPLSGKADAIEQARALFPDPILGEWIYYLLDDTRQFLRRTVRYLDVNALESRYGPADAAQWQLDVQYWFNISMATMQLSLLNTAVDPTMGDSSLETFVARPNISETNLMCQNQRLGYDREGAQWYRGAWDVPITEAGVRLPMLAVNDEKAPTHHLEGQLRKDGGVDRQATSSTGEAEGNTPNNDEDGLSPISVPEAAPAAGLDVDSTKPSPVQHLEQAEPPKANTAP